MKKNKGFTLIELLAVIVILAIIALITVPVVINIINSSKKGAAEASAYGAIDAARLFYYQASIDSNTSTIEFTYDGNEWKYNGNKLEFTGTKPVPNNSSSSFKVNNGNVELVGIKFGAYICNKTLTEEKVTCSTDGSSSTTQTAYKPTKVTISEATHKGIVYLNPTDLTVECNESNSQIGTSEADPSGCMKFYIYDDSGDTYKMILDHNTTAKVAYETSGIYKEYEQASIKSVVDADTTGWVGNPRIITANEIATITNTTTFDGNSGTWFWFNGTGTNKQSGQTVFAGKNIYAWLFDYTFACNSNGYGCSVVDRSTYGYWVSSPVIDIPSFAWQVRNDGTLVFENASNVNYYGVRPVIELSKTQIN